MIPAKIKTYECNLGWNELDKKTLGYEVYKEAILQICSPMADLFEEVKDKIEDGFDGFSNEITS